MLSKLKPMSVILIILILTILILRKLISIMQWDLV